MKYYNSYKLFHGKNSIKEYSALISANTALLIVGGVLIRVVNNEFFQGFMMGLVPFLCGVVAATIGFGLVCAVFNANMPSLPGYRFFHSVANGAGHFRRAILFSNMLSLFPIALYAVIGGLMFQHFIIVVMTITVFFMLGLTNLTSHMKTPWVRLGMFCVVGFAYGFYAGFTGDDEKFIAATLPLNVTIIVCAVVLVFYIASVIVVTMKAEKRWNKEV